MKIFLSLLAWIIASAVHAQTTSPLKDFNNGCGSGWNRPIVPDSIGLLCVDYKKACANHDNCYSRCLPGGATYGLPVCSLTMQDKRAGRRLSCDNKFEDDMDEQCNQCDVIRKRVCKGIASIYRIAVRTGGGGSCGRTCSVTVVRVQLSQTCVVMARPVDTSVGAYAMRRVLRTALT